MLLDSRYLFSIDALLDTRLGVLSNIDRESAATLMGDPLYPDRTMDNFCDRLPKVSQREFNEAWKNRTKVDLAASVSTHIMPWLQKAVLDDMNDPGFNFSSREISIAVNVWPYVLSKDEKKDLKVIIAKFFPAVPKIELWFMSPEQLSPANLRSNLITTAVFYNLSEWAETHKANLDQSPMPETTLIGPELLIAPVDYSKVKAEHRETVMELGPFRASELLMTPYYNLLLLPAAFFCACLIKLKKK